MIWPFEYPKLYCFHYLAN